MARPGKYNWEAIREAYEGGLDKKDICKQYKLTPKLLSNKIAKAKWTVGGHLKAELDAFCEHSKAMAQNIEALHPKNQELVLKKIDTLAEDNELIGNNRKIAKMLQGIIMTNKKEITINNIKNISGVIRDIESIANPTPGINIQNTNAVQNNVLIKVEWE